MGDCELFTEAVCKFDIYDLINCIIEVIRLLQSKKADMHKNNLFLGLALAAAPGFLWAQTIPTISCQSPSSILNTGRDDSTDTRLAPNSPDPQWFIGYSPLATQGAPNTAMPAASVAWQASVVPTTAHQYFNTRDPINGYPNADWISRLINTTTTGGGNIPDIQVYYRTQFNLAPEVPPSALNYHFGYHSDDELTRVFVNGTAASPNVPSVLSGSWQAGLNTVIFSVVDYGWLAGLVVSGQAALCDVSPIRVEKTASQTVYAANSPIAYDVTVENKGLLDVIGNSVADSLPAGVTNAQWSCTSSLPSNGSCPVAPISAPLSFDLKASEKLTFTLSGTTAQTGSLLNTATLTPGALGVCAADTTCEAKVSPTLTMVPDLSPTWTAAPPALTVNQPTSYTLQIANGGGAANTDGSLVITLPANMEFTGAAPAGCLVSGATMTCSLQAITASGGTSAISFTAQATAAFAGASISAAVTTVTGETELTNNTASTPVAATAVVTPPVTTTATPVPSLADWGLALLTLLMGMVGFWGARKRA